MTADQSGNGPDIERIVRAAMSRNGKRLAIEDISSATAMSQDAGIDGIDVYDFAKDLEGSFGDLVWQIPWGRFSDQRASFYGCSIILVPFWLAWRLICWPFNGAWIPPPNGGEYRLTVAHLANVFSSGEWFEPPELIS